MPDWFASTLEEIPAGQKPVAYTVAFVMLAVAIELVRRRKLREEYALLWLITGLVLLVLAWQHQWLAWFQRLISAKSPVSALIPAHVSHRQTKAKMTQIHRFEKSRTLHVSLTAACFRCQHSISS